MTRSRSIGGGNVGGTPVTLTCLPDSTFVTEITALIAAITKVVGKLVTFTGSNTYEVTSAAANAQPDGEVIAYERDADGTYILTCEIWHYTSGNTTEYPATCVRHLPYGDGTIAVGNDVQIHGTTYMYVDGASGSGWGLVIAKDSQASGYVDVLCQGG